MSVVVAMAGLLAAGAQEPYVEVLYNKGHDVVKVIRNLMSAGMCEELIALAERSYTSASMVFMREGATNQKDGRFRVANTTHLYHGYWRYPVEQAVAERIQSHVKVPLRNFEGLQVTSYSPGGFYSRHQDGFNRSYTALLYLNDVDEDAGGETEFFLLTHPGKRLQVKPKRGDAVIFSSQLNHESKPITRGKKLVANQWIHKDTPQPFVIYYIVPILVQWIPLEKEVMALHYWLCTFMSETLVIFLYNFLSVLGMLLAFWLQHRRAQKSKTACEKRD